MGYIAHHAVIVVISGYAWSADEYYRAPKDDYYGVTAESFEAWRSALPEEFQRLIIGPVKTLANGDYVIAMLPDGSKEGWDTSGEGDRIRGELIDMFKFSHYPVEHPTDSPFDVAEMRFGGDDNDLLWIEDRHLTPERG
jgi:hypothetical protein